jgi:hypothetical protein
LRIKAGGIAWMVIALMLGGCASDDAEVETTANGNAAPYGEGSRPSTAGERKLLPLPPELRGRVVISNRHYGRSWPVERDDVIPKAMPSIASKPRTVAVLDGGVPLERNPLFPRDERSELSESISLVHEPSGQGMLARSGRVVAAEEDVVFQAGQSGRLDLLRPPESALNLEGGGHLYGEALRGRDLMEIAE